MYSKNIDLIELALWQTDQITQAAQFLDEQLNHDLFSEIQKLIVSFQITSTTTFYTDLLYYPQQRFEQQKITFVPAEWLQTNKNKIAENWFKHFFAYAYFELDLFEPRSTVYQFQSRYFYDHAFNYFCIRFKFGWQEHLKDLKLGYLKTQQLAQEFKAQEKILLEQTINLKSSGFEIDPIQQCWVLKIDLIKRDQIIQAYRNVNLSECLQPILDALFKIQSEFDTFQFLHTYMQRCVQLFYR